MATALEVRASGIHYTFAPCVAVSLAIFLCILASNLSTKVDLFIANY